MKNRFKITRNSAGLPPFFAAYLALLFLVGGGSLSLAEYVENRQTSPFPRPEKIKGIYISGWTAGSARKLEGLLELIDKTELNAVVIDVKDARGRVTYRSEVPKVRELKAGSRLIGHLPTLLKKLKARNIYPIARLVCFKDPLLSEAEPELALKRIDGTLWRESGGGAWLDPYNKKGWDYLVDLSKEAVRLGFEEVHYDYVRFPTEGDVGAIDYGESARGSSRSEAIAGFLAYAREELAPSGAAVSAALLGIVLSNRRDALSIGQDYLKIAGEVDSISPMVYPSHYANAAQNGSGQLINEVLFKYPDLEPYALVYNVLSPAKKRLDRSKGAGRLRPWLQAFTASYLGEDRYRVYGGEEVAEQIRAVYTAGIEEWILWNSKNIYSADGLLSEEDYQNEVLDELIGELAEELEAGEGNKEREAIAL